MEIIIGIEIGGLGPLTGGVPVCEGVGSSQTHLYKKGVGVIFVEITNHLCKLVLHSSVWHQLFSAGGG